MVVYLRIHAYGWTEEKALTTPKMPRGRVSFVNQMRASEQGKVITMPVYRDNRIKGHYSDLSKVDPLYIPLNQSN